MAEKKVEIVAKLEKKTENKFGLPFEKRQRFY